MHNSKTKQKTRSSREHPACATSQRQTSLREYRKSIAKGWGRHVIDDDDGCDGDDCGKICCAFFSTLKLWRMSIPPPPPIGQALCHAERGRKRNWLWMRYGYAPTLLFPVPSTCCGEEKKVCLSNLSLCQVAMRSATPSDWLIRFGDKRTRVSLWNEITLIVLSRINNDLT